MLEVAFEVEVDKPHWLGGRVCSFIQLLTAFIQYPQDGTQSLATQEKYIEVLVLLQALTQNQMKC